MPDRDPILAEILLKLGRIEEKQDRVRVDLDDYRKDTHHYREVMNDKVDRIEDRVAKTESSITVSAAIDVQVRDELNSIRPVLSEFKSLKTYAIAVGSVLTAIGALFGATWQMTWETIVKFFRNLGG